MNTKEKKNKEKELKKLVDDPIKGRDECGLGSLSSVTSNRTSTMNELSLRERNRIFKRPQHPDFSSKSTRLVTFLDWPRQMRQKPEDLAEAGFFYTGRSDKTVCFQCGGGLKDWEENDDPWQQHALWFSQCAYLKS